jgi:DNA replicative helicase MCM subunit Mcm2 (Cdc46/Mcm family)
MVIVKKFICKQCSHEVVYHTDMPVVKPEVCSVCKGKDFQEKRSES